jgi:anti-sigma regulatory factor (Ser/Thr protein kinase)
VVLLSNGRAKQDFPLLFGSRHLTNLIGCASRTVDPHELRATVGKILDRDVFGLEKYFPAGIALEMAKASDSSGKVALIASAEEFANRYRIQPRLATLFTTVVDEFVTNALYHAPVDPSGQSRYGHLPRSKPVRLEDGEEIAIAFACDGTRLGVSVRDPFGSLTEKLLIESLARCFRGGAGQFQEKSGGAGMGFFLSFQSLSQLVVNLDPGKRTEMIGLINVKGSYREFASGNKSFNLFIGDGRA